ncbi:hypothetical protein FRC00_008744, partial [Tulasnella sp. 408]
MQVLRNLEKPELAAAALVCRRTWTNLALDVLWEELESLRPIMAILGPVRRYRDGWDWDDGLPSGDWTRFTSYAKRVRSLSYCSGDERDDRTFSDQISSHVPTRWLYYVALHQGRYLLPQIRTIDWGCNDNGQLEMVLPFLSPTTKDIRINTWGDVLPTGVDRILRALPNVLPSGVRVLSFIPHNLEPEKGIPEELLSFFGSLDELRELRVPHLDMEPAMFRSGRLRVLEASCNLESGIAINALLSQLADTCPLLEHLRIMFKRSNNINFRVIRPLIGCSKLRNLDIEYNKTFDLRKTEIHEMGWAWREMEVLHIASRPQFSHREPPVGPVPGIPFGLLLAFAESFSPKLRKLGLRVSTQDIPAPPDSSISFPNLEILFLGNSELDDSDKAK